MKLTECVDLKHEERLRNEIGGEFEAVGKLEHFLLRALGLQDDQVVVDVGCGCGRLAAQLSRYPEIRYMGCDVNPDYLGSAEKTVNRPDWEFVHTSKTAIPFPDAVGDFVCFFSVFTHLLHEDSFRYLLEAHRVLKPGGLAVFSFLEFKVQSHWELFIRSVESGSYGHLENQFIDRDAIRSWASHSGFDVIDIHDGDKAHFEIPEVVIWDAGQRMEGKGNLGQSVAVLRRQKDSNKTLETIPNGLSQF